MVKPVNLFYLLIIYSCLFLLSSCGGIRNYKYFQDIPDSLSVTKVPTSSYIEPKIQSDDILYIVIQTVDPLASNSINSINSQSTASLLINNNLNSVGSSSNQGTTYGFLVDKKGNVNIPILGVVSLGGLSTQQARELITEKASRYYKDPSVIIRFANFKISVLGEVQKPGTYTIPNERISILDAIGYAGDLTIYGKRDNVLLLRRESNGSTSAIRFNLNKSEILRSPYFYLQQNDQVYVEPNKAKISNSDGSQIRNISIASAVLSFLVVLVTRL